MGWCKPNNFPSKIENYTLSSLIFEKTELALSDETNEPIWLIVIWMDGRSDVCRYKKRKRTFSPVIVSASIRLSMSFRWDISLFRRSDSSVSRWSFFWKSNKTNHCSHKKMCNAKSTHFFRFQVEFVWYQKD